MVRFSLAFVGFLTILNRAIAAPSDLDPLATLLRMKRQFGTQDSSLQQTLQGLQGTQQQQQGNRRPGQSGSFQGQNTGGQGFGGFNSGGPSNSQGQGSSLGLNNNGFISGQLQESNNNQGSSGQGTSGQGSESFINGQSTGGFAVQQSQSGFSNGQSQGLGSGQSIQNAGGFSSQNFGSSQGQSNQGSGSGNGNYFPINGMTTIRSPLNVVTNENSLNPQLRDCIRERCPSTNQYNPVCGDDNITYTNRQKLECAQRCNSQVQLVYRGSCVTTPAPNRR